MASSPETAPAPPDPLTASETVNNPSSNPPPSDPQPQSPPPTSAPPPASPLPSSPPPAQASPPPPSISASPPPPENTPSPPRPPENTPSSPRPPENTPSSPRPPENTPSPPQPPVNTPSPPQPPVNNPSPPPNVSGSSPPLPNSSPPPPGSPPAPIFSPPPPDTLTSQSPPSPGQSRSPRPPSSPSANRTSGSSLPGPNASPPSSGSVTLDTGIVVAIVIGGLVIIALLVFGLIWSRRKKKPQYYTDPSRPPPQGGDQHYYGTQQSTPQPMDHIVQVHPPPGVMGTPVVMATPGGGWVPPPTPPRANNSGDFSGGYSAPSPLGMAHAPSPSMAAIGAKSQFTYEELAAATGAFSQANLLGQGGFGLVHKGVLPNGKEVAVKSLKSGSGQGEREFQAEVEIISRVHHRHLVSLVGYCIAEGQRMLVYEFVPNKTLEFHLHGKGQPVMDWPTRLRIALGSARGLAYLHEDCHPRIIHRDIKAANILLDLNCEAMVADFGLAKLTSDNYTHVSTRVMGTFGYLAPEYASSGKLTEKSDVFSFGVMLLELITGRRPLDFTDKNMEDSLVDWARPVCTKALEDGNYAELVDPRLEENFDPQEMARMVACAAASVRHSGRRRPKMSQIVRALDGVSSLDDLNEGVKGGVQSPPMNPNGESGAYDTRAYDADMTKFRKMVMSSQDFNSSEFGGRSESEQNTTSSSSNSDSQELDRRNSELRKL